MYQIETSYIVCECQDSVGGCYCGKRVKENWRCEDIGGGGVGGWGDF